MAIQQPREPRDLQPYQQTQQTADISLDELRAVKDVIARDCTDAELRVFLAACKRTGLDPFARQIYAIKRGGKLTIQTSIDGFRSTAEDTKLYGGQLPPEWCGSDGVWVDVWLKSEPPLAARVGVIRLDWKQVTWGVTKYTSFKQDTDPWRKMPEHMLAIRAEALALRKAFPHQLGGVYTREEIDDAEREHDYAPMVDAEPVREPQQPQRRLPDVTPIPSYSPPPRRILSRQDAETVMAHRRAVAEQSTPEPALSAESSEQVVTMQMCYDYAKRQHVTAQAWNELQRRCSKDPQLIWDALHTSEAEDIEEEDAALATMAGFDAPDDDAQDAITSFAEAFADATPEQDVPIADAAWNDLQRRMAALNMPVSEQEALIFTITGKSGMSELDARDWHKVNGEVATREADAAQAHEYDLAKAHIGRRGGRH